MYTCMFPFAKHGIQSSNTARQKIHAKQHHFVLLNFQFWKAYIILTERDGNARNFKGNRRDWKRRRKKKS